MDMSLPIIAAGAAALGVLFYAMNSKAAPGLGGKKGKAVPLPTKPAVPGFKPEPAIIFAPEAKVEPKITVSVGPSVQGLEPNQARVVTQTDPLNIRKEANSSSKIVGKAAKGSILDVTGASVNGPGSVKGWIPVAQANINGFASADFLQMGSNVIDLDTPMSPSIPEVVAAENLLQGALASVGLGGLAPSLASVGNTATVNTAKDPLNLRKAPSSTSAILGKLAKGSTVNIMGPTVSGPGSAKGWAPVTQGSLSGYAAADFLSM
jgi:uncharacterized protein YgiM (DUF1202 family)